MDSYIASRMEAEDIDEEEANFRTWIDLVGERIGHAAALEDAKEMRARGEFKPKVLPEPVRRTSWERVSGEVVEPLDAPPPVVDPER
jgi:hypothetical protein